MIWSCMVRCSKSFFVCRHICNKKIISGDNLNNHWAALSCTSHDSRVKSRRRLWLDEAVIFIKILHYVAYHLNFLTIFHSLPGEQAAWLCGCKHTSKGSRSGRRKFWPHKGRSGPYGWCSRLPVWQYSW